MKFINYAALTNVMRSQKPYRGSINRYPLVNRRHSSRFFLYETTDDGEPYMRIINGYNYNRHEITKEEYEANAYPDTSKDPVRIWNKGKYTNTGKYVYHRYEKVPYEIGIVRPDNSFEFTRKSYYQGDMMFMTKLNKGYFCRDSRRGGMIYANRRTNMMYPIFTGMRIDCDLMTPEPSKKYELLGMRVNRKAGKELLKSYEDFLLTAKPMMKVLSQQTFFDIGVEVMKAYPDWESSYYLQDEIKQSLKEYFHQHKNDSPLDAAAAFCIVNGTHGIRDYYSNMRQVSINQAIFGNDQTAEMYYDPMKRLLTKQLYKDNHGVMRTVSYEFGQVYPPSEWGYTVLVDGIEVNQC